MKKLFIVFIAVGLMTVACKPGSNKGNTYTKMADAKMSVVEAVCTKMDSCKMEQMKKLSEALKAKYNKEVPSKMKCMKMLKMSKDAAKNSACKAALQKASCGAVTEMRMKACKHLM